MQYVFFVPLSHSLFRPCTLSLYHRPTKACCLKDNSQLNVGPHLLGMPITALFTRQLVMTIAVKVIAWARCALIALCLCNVVLCHPTHPPIPLLFLTASFKHAFLPPVCECTLCPTPNSDYNSAEKSERWPVNSKHWVITCPYCI